MGQRLLGTKIRESRDQSSTENVSKRSLTKSDGPAQSRGESRLGHTSRLAICRLRNKVTAIEGKAVGRASTT